MVAPTNSDRQNAITFGLGTYTGKVHARCGTSQRYAKGGGCVHCARLVATEQREARKYLQTVNQPGYHEAEAQAPGFEPIGEVENDFVVDTSQDAVIDDENDDAEAARLRREESFDELM